MTNATLLYVRWVFMAIIASAAMIDLYLLVSYGEKGTISELLRQISLHWPLGGYLLAFFAGCLFFHILGPR